jgi:hypothetical protein
MKIEIVIKVFVQNFESHTNKNEYFQRVLFTAKQ